MRYKIGEEFSVFAKQFQVVDIKQNGYAAVLVNQLASFKHANILFVPFDKAPVKEPVKAVPGQRYVSNGGFEYVGLIDGNLLGLNFKNTPNPIHKFDPAIFRPVC